MRQYVAAKYLMLVHSSAVFLHPHRGLYEVPAEVQIALKLVVASAVNSPTPKQVAAVPV